MRLTFLPDRATPFAKQGNHSNALLSDSDSVRLFVLRRLKHTFNTPTSEELLPRTRVLSFFSLHTTIAVQGHLLSSKSAMMQFAKLSPST